MRPEDILEFLRRRPFEPFRVFTTDGQTYDVHHPDQTIVLRSRMILPVGGDAHIPERADHLALVHIVRVQELGPESQRQAG